MSKNIEAKTESIRLLMELNHELSHDLQTILFLIDEINQISEEKFELLTYRMADAIKKYSRFREFSYDIIGINDEDENKLVLDA